MGGLHCGQKASRPCRGLDHPARRDRELLDVSKRRAHQIAPEPGGCAPFADVRVRLKRAVVIDLRRDQHSFDLGACVTLGPERRTQSHRDVRHHRARSMELGSLERGGVCDA